ncbi:MAG: hypothetical protein NTX64_13220 [Elusimicrobia bacterium]|nr:hypothetical protein [Elusimicrobiota bacterium]
MAARAVPLRRQHPRHIEPLRSRRRHAVAALTLALLAAHPPARAKERTEKKKHAAELGFRSDHNEVQIFIDKSKDYSPVEGVEPGREPEAMHALMEKLRGLSAELLTPMERLDTLRGGYSNLADLSPIEAERNSLRRFLLDGRKQLEDQVEQFDTLGKMRAFAGVREIFGRGVTEASRQSIREATTMLFFTAEMRNFRLKLNSILDEEEKAYQQKRKEIEERRARAAARRHAAAAAAALLAVAAGGAWGWSSRPPTSPSSGRSPSRSCAPS